MLNLTVKLKIGKPATPGGPSIHVGLLKYRQSSSESIINGQCTNYHTCHHSCNNLVEQHNIAGALSGVHGQNHSVSLFLHMQTVN